MNYLFLGSLITFVSSVCFAHQTPTWPKEVVHKLKSKDPQNAICTSSGLGLQTKAACSAFSKDTESSGKKWPTVTLKNGNITLSDGTRTIEIKRTDVPTRFEINNKTVELAEHRNFQSLHRAISSSLPKVAVRRSLWINSAQAQWSEEGMTVYERMARAAHFLISATSDQEACEAAHKFIKACAVNIEEDPDVTLFKHFTNKLAQGRKLTADDKRMFTASLETLRYSLFKMRNLTAGFDKKTDALLACPSVSQAQNRSAANDVIDCAQRLEGGIEDMGELSGVLEQMKPETASHIADVKKELEDLNKTSSPTADSVKKAKGTR